MQVRTDFRQAVKKMMSTPAEYMAVMSQHTKFTNREGIFGDTEIMSLTRDDNEYSVPTYQFWAEHGKHTLVLLCLASVLTLIGNYTHLDIGNTPCLSCRS